MNNTDIITKLRIAMTDARQNESHFESWMILNEAICDAIDALAEQPAQQEPVAKHYANGGHLVYPKAQRQWVGLTDEEVYMNCPSWLSQEQCKAWIHQIEAALRSKNT